MEKVGIYLGWAASLAAVISLGVSGWQIERNLYDTKTQQWEEVVVYSIVVDSGSSGIGLDDIQNKYEIAARNLPVELPREAHQTDTIKRTLISLQAQNTVVLLINKRYMAVSSVPQAPPLPYEEVKEITDKVLDIVNNAPHQFTEEQLKAQVMQQIPKITRSDLDYIFNNMVFMTRILAFDGAGKAVLTNRFKE